MLTEKQKKVINELNDSFLLNYSMSEILISNVIGDNEELLNDCLRNAKNHKEALEKGDIFSEHKFRILGDLYKVLDFINEDFRKGWHEYKSEMNITDNECVFVLKKGDDILEEFNISLSDEKNIYEKKSEIVKICSKIYGLIEK